MYSSALIQTLAFGNCVFALATAQVFFFEYVSVSFTVFTCKLTCATTLNMFFYTCSCTLLFTLPGIDATTLVSMMATTATLQHFYMSWCHLERNFIQFV